MTARRVRTWLDTMGTKPLFIEPGSPWENGYCESFNGMRPHSALGYRPPAPLTWMAAA
jgi:transposase InsO family protein